LLIRMTKIGLVLDCSDPERLAQYWAEALGYERIGAAGSCMLLYTDQPAAPKLRARGRVIAGRLARIVFRD
jgi:hypothetical protein